MRRSQDDFEDELRAHLELEAEQLRRDGLPEAEAAVLARRRFGNLTRATEQFYLSRRRRWLDTLRNDVRFGLRVLRRSPLVTAVAIAVLAVGIGATTTLYTAIDAVVLRPLPFADPDRLAVVGVVNPRREAVRAGASAADFHDWQELTRSFAALAAYRPWGYELESDVEPERVTGARVSPDLFTLLGVTPLRGRVFHGDEGVEGREHVVVLSDTLWRRRFGGDQRILGRDIRLNGIPYQIVGIVRSDEMLPDAALWVPLVFAPYELAQRGDRPLSVVGRLERGVSVDAAAADMERLAHELARRYPEADAGWEAYVASLHRETLGNSRQTLLLLFAATLSLLVVACANLANLLFARGLARRRELALRVALGASRGRLFRQLVTEAALLVGAGGLLGLLVAAGAVHALSALGPEYLPRARTIRVDGTSVAFVLALMALTAAGLAAVTARLVNGMELGATMKEADAPRPGTTGLVARDAFLVTQVAVALVLLVGGTLLVVSFRRIQAVQLGFAPEHVLGASVSLPASRYEHDEQRLAFFEAAVERLRALPGVEDAAVASRLPLATTATSGIMSTVAADGMTTDEPARVPRAATIVVSPGYFTTMGMRLLTGRAFDARDRSGGRPVVVVDESLARMLSPGGRVVGMQVKVGGGTGGDTAQREIIGVVAPIRLSNIVHVPEPVLYLPYAQASWPSMSLLLRAADDPRAQVGPLRSTIAALDPTRPLYNVRPLAEGVERTLAGRRFETLLLAGFAASALMLAILGVYGMLTFTVTQRTRELGIRLALGASARQVRSLVLRYALTRIGIGLAAGTLLAVTCGGFLRSELYDVSPWDWRAFGAAFAILAIAGVLASDLPARRASRTDPLLVIRSE